MNTTRFVTTQDQIGHRLDMVLHECLPGYSRSFFQKLIKQGHVTVDGRVATKASTVLTQVCTIDVHLPSDTDNLMIADDRVHDLGVKRIEEHADFVIIDKPAGLVVHKPAHTSKDVTLVDWILYHYPEAAHSGQPGRPGIVHRLDKDTSGLMIIARTHQAYDAFTHLFKTRDITKVYCAIVEGHPPANQTITYAIRRHPTHPLKMSHSRSEGKSAQTSIAVEEYLHDAAVILAYPQTGRTHQIRVHCAAAGYPILGDTVYGHASARIARQALHAYRLSFVYGDKKFSYESPIPADMQQAISFLS